MSYCRPPGYARGRLRDGNDLRLPGHEFDLDLRVLRQRLDGDERAGRGILAEIPRVDLILKSWR